MVSANQPVKSPESAEKPGWVRRRYVTWLSLSLMSFMALMMLIVYESRWVYPEIQAYFSQTGSLTGQQLATRSRAYLQNAQQTLLNDQPMSGENIEAISLNLDLAYGLMDVSVYHQEYACTGPSVTTVGSLTSRLTQDALSPLAASRELLEPINCLTHIEMDQLDRRGMVINNFSESTRRHSQMLIYSSMTIFIMGLLFWGMHERQLRRTQRATEQKIAWMKRAMRDPLTGIGNRSALHQEVMARANQPLGLILVDIDFFKQYNDELGHPAGDQLLRRLASLLKKQLGTEAKLYRLGGDEFAAVLPCADDTELAQYCESLITGLTAEQFNHPAHPDNKQVTLSIGAVRFIAVETTFAYAYETADKALYSVKAAGRDGWQISAGA
ncbi:GGDEF domain-containing protein [Halomonas sp. 7T]|uniref:GGDEF domain-containing protein n=1 Tax=Halomonas sp. 7T TaxID=2893469 RepID=UPI0021DA202A|nr:GGDEF domain-containing protein [Halomonas sp. 7T]UXZ55383.1 GGDEF domain-containing protein [Halomonas sp. 7T]